MILRNAGKSLKQFEQNFEKKYWDNFKETSKQI